MKHASEKYHCILQCFWKQKYCIFLSLLICHIQKVIKTFSDTYKLLLFEYMSTLCFSIVPFA